MIDSKVSEFLGKTRKKYGDGVLSLGCDARAVHMTRVSSGSFDLDVALGGGWPFNRCILLHGPESSGKTLLAIKLCVELQSLDRNTRKHFLDLTPEEKDKFEPCRAFWCDMEGTFDGDWATAMGFNMDHHLVAKPGCAEDAVDLMTAAMEEDIVDVVVADSLEMFTPAKAVEKGAGEAMMDGRAILLNRAFRKWVNLMVRKGDNGPMVFCINQEREKIGVMYGDPMTLPGGKGQLFAASIRVRMKRPEVTDVGAESEKLSSAIVELRGSTPKNKTYLPKLEFSAKISIRDNGRFKKGDIDNAGPLYKVAKSLGLCSKSGWETGRMVPKEEGSTEVVKEVIKTRLDDEMIEIIHKDVDLYHRLRSAVLARIFS